MMILRKYRWSKDYESAEEELHHHLQLRSVKAERWVGEEYQIFDEHSHAYDTTLWCAEGSLAVTADGQRFSLQPGDALDLPADTPFSAAAGIAGCVCYETQL